MANLAVKLADIGGLGNGNNDGNLHVFGVGADKVDKGVAAMLLRT